MLEGRATCLRQRSDPVVAFRRPLANAASGLDLIRWRMPGFKRLDFGTVAAKIETVLAETETVLDGTQFNIIPNRNILLDFWH